MVWKPQEKKFLGRHRKRWNDVVMEGLRNKGEDKRKDNARQG